jgi:hypothetical protein
MEAFDGISFMTDSHQRQEHIQSYFMFIPSQVIPKLMKVGFFHTFRNWHFKRTIIEKGEYKIKENLDLIEVNSRVIFQVESFVADKSKLKLVNPTIHFAADLLGCNAPFLKKSALLIKT